MKIGMILLGHTFPPDIRVDKELQALCGSGREIHLMTELGKDQKPLEIAYGGKGYIHRYSIKVRSALLRFVTGAYFHLIRREYVKHIADFIVQNDIQILHVHDLNFLPTVFYTIRKYKFDVKVVADLHENMPAAWVAYRSDNCWPLRLLRSIIYNYRIWKRAEKKCFLQCAAVIAVVPEAKKRMLEYGVDPKKIWVVSNTENQQTFPFSREQANAEIIQKYQDDFVISYIGGLGPHRGMQTLIKGFERIANEMPSARLLIVGAKQKDSVAIQKMLAKVKDPLIRGRVEIIGWVPFSDVNSYVLASNICTVPHEDFEHTQTTIPHKLFQYMICRSPVLVSDCAPLKRIIGDNDAGYVFKAGDSASLASAVREMNSNWAEVKRRVEKAFDLAAGEYSWTRDAERLKKMYQEILN